MVIAAVVTAHSGVQVAAVAQVALDVHQVPQIMAQVVAELVVQVVLQVALFTTQVAAADVCKIVTQAQAVQVAADMVVKLLHLLAHKRALTD
jgi:hypothetical protein